MLMDRANSLQITRWQLLHKFLFPLVSSPLGQIFASLETISRLIPGRAFMGLSAEVRFRVQSSGTNPVLTESDS